MSDLVERLFLKYSPVFSQIRRWPRLYRFTHRISHRLVPPGRLVWVQVRRGPGRGLWLKLDPRTGWDYFDGRVEPATQQVLTDRLRPGMVFYDLGANLGMFSLLAARLVGAEGRVYSFEADPEMARRLRENVDKNGFRNVRVINKAVWSSAGSVTFSRADIGSSPDRGWGRVVRTPASAARSINVPCISLDDFVQTEAPPHIVKCDVEGAEYEVFTGAHALLAGQRPLVACEVHSDQIGVQMTQLFGASDYALNWFDPRHCLATPKQMGCS